MNNSNFGYDCRNNFDNSYFSPVAVELEEMSYIRKYQSIHNTSMKESFSSEHLKIQINKDFNNKISQLDINDRFYEARKSLLEMQRNKQLDACKSIKNQNKKNICETV